MPEVKRTLTPREGQVFEELAAGPCNKIIARHLDISEHTVKVHIRRLLEKLGARNRVQLALLSRAAKQQAWFEANGRMN